MLSPPQAVEVRELTKKFGRFTAVDRLTFEVTAGEIFGFLGPNGAGKSTTIRMLCGLLTSSSGTARVGGYDINRQPDLVRRHIGYMSQRFSLYRDLTVTENLAFFGGVYGLSGSRLRERVADAARMAGLAGREAQLTGTLSGAVQQRLALASAVLHAPPLLFLDEPTSGVDPVSRRRFWELIQDIAGWGTTVLVTTHFMDEAEFCGRIGLISAGRLVALGAPGSVKASVDEDVFEVTVEDLPAAVERLKTVPAILATACFGPRLHVYARRGDFTPASLNAALAALPLPVTGVRPAGMSLEDAFLRLVTATQSSSTGGPPG